MQPREVGDLAAQSHVQVSFDTPEYTANADALGTLRILEAVRLLGMEKQTKIYQASTSEMFGQVVETPQRETTSGNHTGKPQGETTMGRVQVADSGSAKALTERKKGYREFLTASTAWGKDVQLLAQRGQ